MIKFSEVDYERLLIRAAFLEWRVAKSYSTGSTVEVEPRKPRGRQIIGPLFSASWPPARFVREELGFAIEHGPSLAWTCKTLAKTNRDALKMLLRDDVPLRVTYPRN